MSDDNPFGYKDHAPFSGFSDELVYGLTPDGNSVHISRAERGLSCGCRCPACHQTLIARKGKKKIHHFAHYARGGTCSHVVETNAHAWAKEVLDRVKWITLPEVIAEHDGKKVIRHPSQRYEFAGARLEKQLDNIIPDVVLVLKNGIELIVEVRVTHACDERKIDKLRQSNLSAIEIDLRHYRTSQDRLAVEQALLVRAGRAWLNNAKKMQYDAQLRERLEAQRAKEEADAKAAAEFERKREIAQLERDRRRVEREIAPLLKTSRTTPALNVQETEELNKCLEEFSFVPFAKVGSIGFTVPDKFWQVELAREIFTYPAALHYHREAISVSNMLEMVDQWILPEFRKVISPAGDRRLKEIFPGRRLPLKAIEAFAARLTANGLLEIVGHNLFQVSQIFAEEMQESIERRIAYENRKTDISSKVQSLLDALPKQEAADFSIHNWFEKTIDRLQASPEHLCRDERWSALHELKSALHKIKVMCDGGEIVDDLLGLPFQGELLRAKRRVQEESLQASQRRRLRLRAAASSTLGDEANGWLSAPSEDDEEISRIDFAGLDESSLCNMLNMLHGADLDRRLRLAAEAEVLACKGDLTARAAQGLRADKVPVFLNAQHSKLGISPLQHCIDRRTLAECVALLPRPRRKRSGR